MNPGPSAILAGATLAEWLDQHREMEIIVRTGDAATELLKVAADRWADAIVIGTVRRFRHLAAAPARLVWHACCPPVVVP